MKKIRERYKKQFNILFFKNAVTVFVPVLVVFALLFSLFYSSQRKNIKQITTLSEQRIFDKRVNNLEKFFSDIQASSRDLSENNQLTGFFYNTNLLKKQQEFRSYVKVLDDFFKVYRINNPYMEMIALYSENGNYLMKSNGSSVLRDEFLNEMIQKALKNKKSTFFSYYDDGEYINNNRIIVVKNIEISSSNNAVILYSVYYRDFMEYIGALDRNTAVFTVEDGEGKVLFKADNHKYKEKNAVYFSHEIPEGYRIKCVVDLSEALKPSNCINSYTLIFIILILFVTIIITLLIAYKLLIPFKKINSILNENFNDNPYGKEYAFIFDNVRQTVSSKYFLEEKLSSQLEQLKEMQNFALQVQIKPHFLFNTLQVISLYADELIDGDNKVSYMIEKMSDMLRYSLSTASFLTDIANELEYTKCYIMFQQENYYDKFDVSYDISPEIMHYQILKITLQPIIENAIKYGIKPSKRKCMIKIEAKEEDGKIVFEVKNNGELITEKRANEVNKMLENISISRDSNIGLNNVNSRIKVVFGVQYGVRIFNNSDKETVTRIEFSKTMTK